MQGGGGWGNIVLDADELQGFLASFGRSRVVQKQSRNLASGLGGVARRVGVLFLWGGLGGQQLCRARLGSPRSLPP